MSKTILIFFATLFFAPHIYAEDGYRLWLRYNKIKNAQWQKSYQDHIKCWLVEGNSPTLEAASKELGMGLEGLLDNKIPKAKSSEQQGILIAGTPTGSPLIAKMRLEKKLEPLGNEGFTIFTDKTNTVIAANSDAGVLYGVFHFLRLLQTNQPIDNLNISSSPKLQRRILNHWDNLDRTVERGYAGFSIWNWHTLPDYLDPRYTDYARANASIGINGTVLTNVNANALVLRPDYLEKVKALADLLRPYNIKVYLTARFSAPIELGKLSTADPLDPTVQKWWKEKAEEIYRLVPDFGGFVVKANSEGQPGPQNYGRSHADGANLLADALAPHGGIVMWRAFVYSAEDTTDRHRQAYSEFVPMDGSFRSNVMIQVKNGPIDFQPREPAHPMFGAMPETPLMMEFQITQEYTGQGTHLVFLAPMWKEVLDFDMQTNGVGSTVANVLRSSKTKNKETLTGIAGVSNVGNDRNWTGYHFGQANWYAFGRLAWDSDFSSEKIADEWIRMTFSNDEKFVESVKKIMLNSHEACVNYMTPLGLHHIMATGHHYGPGPWVGDLSRPEWNPTYYHRADSLGIGFDRTSSGSNAVEQYAMPVREMFSSRKKCPEKYLLWFHHVGWNEKLASGKTLWVELCEHYYKGANDVAEMRRNWQSLKGMVDEERFSEVDMMLQIQEKEAKWWRDACLSYFQTFSNLPIPEGYEKPAHTLDFYKSLDYPYSPGIRPRW
ncbi:MAG: alpha-glucuronidase [Bacteroidetes bacterium]|nr:alpha-glucuronidase [Bacteroidota bacterium]